MESNKGSNKTGRINRVTDSKGTTLVELLIVMAVFGFVIAAMFAEYVTLLKNASVTRKGAKTESDIVSVVWPIFKEVESAGFGVPSAGSCTPAIGASGATLTIHSTSAGDQKGSGTWSYVGTGCSVTGIPRGDWVVIIDPLDRSQVNGVDVNVESDADKLATCPDSWVGMLAYRLPASGSGCYETKYLLTTYDSGTRPAMCEGATHKLSRSVKVSASSPTSQPMLDCVKTLAYRFGCINKDTGNLTWKSDASCSASEGSLRLARIAIVLQDSPRTDSQGGATISLFADTGSTQQVTLTEEQRYYRWKKIERTIALRNLE